MEGLDKGKAIVEPVVADWRSLFSVVADQTLTYFLPKIDNGKAVIAPPKEIFEEREHVWRNAIVAQFVGKIPNFSAFQKMVNVLWGESGEVDIRPAGTNLFLIQFPNSETRDRVLESSPWHIQNKLIIIRKWELGLRSLEFNMAKLPIWVKLGNILLELFTQKGISYISSALGNPLYMDRFTAGQQRLAFAKVCIEIDAKVVIPKIIDVILRDGTIGQIYVDIPWMPLKCSYLEYWSW
ncbi:hypothetical protein DITRI_Ditri11bG0127300 [Diplodiscus trichospermus]